MWPTGNAAAVEQLLVSFCSTIKLLGSTHARFGSTSEPSVAVTKNVPTICTSTDVCPVPGTRSPEQSSTFTGFCSNWQEKRVLPEPDPGPPVGLVVTPIGMISTGNGSCTWTFWARHG